MMIGKKNLICLLLLCFTLSVNAQILDPVSWKNSYKESDSGSKSIELLFDATIDPVWYLYSSDFDPELGPMVTTFSFTAHESYELIGDIEAINPKKGYDSLFEGEYTYFRQSGRFKQLIKINQPNWRVSGSVSYQVCSDITGQCIPFEKDFVITGKIAASDNPSKQEEKKALLQQRDVNDPYSLFSFAIIAFLAGLAALLTPCVFPMIPMTVTYFTGKDHQKKGRVLNSLFYGFSIIFIYVLVGALVAPFMGPELANDLATGWLPNVIFFIVFVLFALSFFGLFEITLPHGLVNKVDRLGDKGGLIGVFFMAFTLVLVSFSCTGPIVGSLLVESAGGLVIKPLIGMFAFSLAFAIPFTLFALFPGWLQSMPKSGGWLNSVKVVLGFLELALAFKFLSIADQAYHWGLLDREIFLAIWIVIFSLMGFYLLGKIRLPGDSENTHTSVGGLVLAMATFTFVVYLIPGLFGAPLKSLAGYLPPMSSHDFDLPAMIRDNGGKSRSVTVENNVVCEPPRYADFLHFPHGLKGYFDYEQALNCAKTNNKPIFIDFTGHGCVNCREMEARVWSDSRVLQRLNENFILLALYVDDKTELPSEKWYTSEYDGKVKKSIGKQNADFQITRFQNNAQPFYIILDHDEKMLVAPIAYNLNIESYLSFLDEAIAEHKRRHLP